MRRMSSLLLVVALAACGPKKPAPGVQLPSPPTAPPTGMPSPPQPGAPDAPSAAPAPAELSVGQQVEEINGLLADGRTADDARAALDRLRTLSDRSPDLAVLHYNMGVAYLRLGDVNSARKSFLRTTDIDPKVGDAWYNLGALAEQSGDYDRALRSYQAGLRDEPDNVHLAAGEIGVLRKLKKYSDAEARSRDAIRRNANNIGAYNNLGLVYLDQGKVDLAQFVYQRAINVVEGAVDDASIHCNLGRVYLTQKHKELATAEFEAALVIDPKLVSALMMLGELHLQDHNWDAAVVALEKARDLDPENAAIRMNLGIAYRGLKRFDESKRSYEKALDLNPSNPDPYLNLGVLLGDHMQLFDQALEMIESYRKHGGSRPDLANTWETDLKNRKEKARLAEDRRKRSEESKRKQEERERQRQEEEAKRAAEVPTPPPAPEPLPAAPEAPPPAPAPVEVAPPSSPQPSEPVAPWGGSAPTNTPTEVPTAVVAPPAAPPAAPAGCQQDDQCPTGTTCQQNACAPPPSTPAAVPWGTPAPATSPETGSGTTATPWGP